MQSKEETHVMMPLFVIAGGHERQQGESERRGERLNRIHTEGEQKSDRELEMMTQQSSEAGQLFEWKWWEMAVKVNEKGLN